MTKTQIRKEPITIDKSLVYHLVAKQFPQWKNLSVQPVAVNGWDNRTFRLGEHMLVRLPSAAAYEAQVEKEQRWLPRLAPLLPVSIPEPLAIGEPAEGYPWKWSIYRWIEGNTITATPIADLQDFAANLAKFLQELHRIDVTDGPLPGLHNFYRGGDLQIYDAETRKAISMLKGKIDGERATEVWEVALNTNWQSSPVWVHGDISTGNLLVQDGRLSAIIDFGLLAVGDPSCDLSIAWTLFSGENREIFRTMLPLDAGIWARGRAWTLWKALIIAAGLTNTNASESTKSFHIIDEVLTDHRHRG